MTTVNFAARLRSVPTLPGVYLMRGKANDVLYVGKAANLRNRLRSYFTSRTNSDPKTRKLLQVLADFEFIVTESEQEALILECNFIKEYQPVYNVRLKDDKSYPFIKIDTSEDFPQVYITRRITNDGARYFGPFANAGSVRRTLGLLKKLFPYRSCTKIITGDDSRPCLDFHIHRCVGPCIGAVEKEGYREIINQVILFLEGKSGTIVKTLKYRMDQYSELLNFERAAVLRDQLQAIEKVNERQKVLNVTSENMDVIAAAVGVSEAWVEVFFVRHGKLIGRDNFLMEVTEDDSDGNVLTAFVKQFYTSTTFVPAKILLQTALNEDISIERMISDKRGGKVLLLVPKRGKKLKLVQMVEANALHGMEQLRIRRSSNSASHHTAMQEIQEALSLPRLPQRIECYDISNFRGSHPVGSMVVFEEGKPKPSDYRRFGIENVSGIDDYAMMREILTRRFRHLAPPGGPSEPLPYRAEDETTKWGIVPDLVLIDGGKGHLGAALQVFLEYGIDFIPLASLAKENEELFVPDVVESVLLPRNSQGLFLVQRARDEAHRFAVTFHRARRAKASTKSALDMVPGIGPKRRATLIRRFGSLKGLKEAEVELIAAVPGMSLKAARNLKEYL